MDNEQPIRLSKDSPTESGWYVVFYSLGGGRIWSTAYWGGNAWANKATPNIEYILPAPFKDLSDARNWAEKHLR